MAQTKDGPVGEYDGEQIPTGELMIPLPLANTPMKNENLQKIYWENMNSVQS